MTRKYDPKRNKNDKLINECVICLDSFTRETRNGKTHIA